MKTKVDIVSGFLGAGKTTLIKKLVTEEYKNEKIVVVENEFGKVNIDSRLLKDTGTIVKEITSGCICCSLTDDFITSIMKVREEFNPKRIIIEPTGVALLSEIINSCNKLERKEFIELNNIITIVDVKRFKVRTLVSKEFIDNQIKSTKTVILSKIDDAAKCDINEAVEYIRNINTNVNIIDFDWEKVSAKEIIDAVENAKIDNKTENKPSKLIKGRIHYSKISNKFDSWEFETNKPIGREKIRKIFVELSRESENGNIIRGKGILKGIDGQWFKFDYVNGEITFNDYIEDDIGKVCIIGLSLNKIAIFNMFI